jgi:Tol biopolymer transport system component
MPRNSSISNGLVALAAAALLLLALGYACGGDDETDGGPDGSATQTSAAVTAAPATGSCVPGDGPPSEGAGPDGLEGHITFVRLVFGCQPDIYIMDATGDNATAIATDETIDDESDLSPDGTEVVFFSGREGNAFIYKMNSDGSDLQRLTDGAGGDTSPRWSPDGTQIAFSRSGTLMLMNADGSGQTVIMEAQPAATAEPCRAGSFVGSWAPDGEQITYYSAVVRSGEPSSYWVCSINKDGSGITLLVGEPPEKLHAEPYWSPDGRWIAFRDDRDGDCSQQGSCNYDVFVLDLETGEETNVTNHPSLDIEPAWSPDSEWIVFASNRDDPNFDLYVIHPDGTGVQRLLDDPGAKDSYPSWR